MSTDLLSAPRTEAVPSTSTASSMLDADERWRAWQAKGAAHDEAVRRRMLIVIPIVIVLAIVFYVIVLR